MPVTNDFSNRPVSLNWGSFTGVLVIRALLFGVHIKAPRFLETPIRMQIIDTDVDT